MSSPSASTLPPVLQWTPPGRAVVFFLSATSIWCLLAEFYGLCSMRTFTLWILIPATLLICAMALLDLARGDRRMWRAVVIRSIGGLLGPGACCVFPPPFLVAPGRP